MRRLHRLLLAIALAVIPAAGQVTLTSTPATLPFGSAGAAYPAASFSAAGGVGPYTYAITAGTQPPTLALSSAGALSGTSTTAGTYNFTVTATDSTPVTPLTGSQAFSITINPAPAITTATLPAGAVGVAYSQAIAATGGTGALTFTVPPGTLPTGLSLSSAGVISGSPSAPGTFNFTVTVTDSLGATGTKALSIVINSAPSITTTTLPASTLGLPYSQSITATGGTGALTFSVPPGTLPTGLTLSSLGAISGNSSVAGTFNFTVTVTDSIGATGTKALSITINPAPSITTTTLPAGAVGVAYSQALAATGGTGALTFTVPPGTLPTGLSLSSAGVISGSPSAPGTFNFTVTVTDSLGATGTKALSIVINSAPSITTTTLPASTLGLPYSQSITATGGTGALTFSVPPGTLPTGLTLSSLGAISGNSSVAGTFNFTVTVTDSIGATGTKALSITINPAPSITTTTLPAGAVGVAYSQALAATGGTGALTFTVPPGTLPTGLSLSSAGVISGSPSAPGTFNFTVTVTDSLGAAGSGPLSITISLAPSITTTTLPASTLGLPYSQSITATGGTGALTFSVPPGTLPTGLTLSSLGAISGNSSVAGTFNFTVTVTDSIGATGTKALSITINPAPSITTTTLPASTLGVSYSQALAATGGTGSLTFALTTGTLPTGLSLSSAGVISGISTAAGISSFTVSVTDSLGATGAGSHSITINTAPTISTSSSLPSGAQTIAYSQSLTASGGTGTLTYSLTLGALPTGITLTSAGVLSGTPTVSGNFTFTIRVTDSVTAFVEKSFTLSISPPPNISSLTPSSVSAGAAGFNLTVSGSGFVAGSTVQWAGTALATNFVSATQLSAAVPASLLVTPIAVNITVVNPGPVTSAPAVFTVGAAPSISSITPVVTTAGAPVFNLTVNGSGFNATSMIRFSGQSLVTTFLSINQLSALVTPSLIANAGTASIAVVNAGPVVSNAVSLLINPPTQFVTTTLTPGLIGVAYAQAINVTGGTPPYLFAFTNGALPPGLSLNGANGAITGTPATSGSYDFTVQVTDAAGYVATRAFNLSIARALSISTDPSLPTGAVGLAYSVQLTATGGLTPYSNWQVTTGNLPPGILLNASTGLLSGTPTTTGSFAFLIQVRDSAGQVANKGFTLAINAGLSITTTAQPPTAIIGTAFSFALTAAGGTSPYTWSVATGTLPAGLTLNAANGAITGTPTTAGTASVTVEVKDAAGQTARAPYTFEVLSGLTITNPATLPTATARAPYTMTFQASGGAAPYSSWRIVSGSVPAALVLNNSTGELAGTPAAAGDFSFTIAVNDSTARTVSKAFTLTVLPPGLAILSAPTLPAATFGTPYNFTLQADGGTTPYRWVLVSGNLPAGLSLSNTGLIGGTPTAMGSSTFNVTVLDSGARSTSRDFTLTVNSPALPAFTLSGPADTVDPGTQPRLALELAAPYPSPLSGTIAIAFTTDTVNSPAAPADDPALQFANGSRTLRFTIPAGTTSAEFEGTPALQTGTLAGTIVLTTSFATPSAPIPGVTAPRTIRILRAAPTLRSATATRTATGFDVAVTGYSTPREVTQALFRFTAATGANLQTTELTLPLTTPAAAWFTSDNSRAFGGQFTYRQSFTLSGESAAVTSLSVTLSNSTGASQPSTANVP